MSICDPSQVGHKKESTKLVDPVDENSRNIEDTKKSMYFPVETTCVSENPINSVDGEDIKKLVDFTSKTNYTPISADVVNSEDIKKLVGFSSKTNCTPISADDAKLKQQKPWTIIKMGVEGFYDASKDYYILGEKEKPFNKDTINESITKNPIKKSSYTYNRKREEYAVKMMQGLISASETRPCNVNHIRDDVKYAILVSEILIEELEKKKNSH